MIITNMLLREQTYCHLVIEYSLTKESLKWITPQRKYTNITCGAPTVLKNNTMDQLTGNWSVLPDRGVK